MITLSLAGQRLRLQKDISVELAIVKGALHSPVCVCTKNIKGLSQILKWMILM